MLRELLCAALLASAPLGLAARANAEPALPETQAPLRLIGTVVAAQVERSMAVIDDQGATRVVRTGDEVGAARVQEIHKDGIVLVRAGRLERLALAPVAIARAPEPAGTGDSAAVDDAHGTDSLDPAERDARARLAARRSRMAKRAPAKSASAVPASAARGQDGEDGSEVTQRVSSDQLLVNLSQQARYRPLLDDEGQLRGVALLDVRPDSQLERLGLRSGDVVVSVAGVPVDNSAQAFNALRGLNPRAGGEVMVERGGLPTRITIPPGAL
ncbi:MAG: type II secretion system protein N [Myxococcota bacterium]